MFIKNEVKESGSIVWPQVVRPTKKSNRIIKKLHEKYLFSRALLHLRDHFTQYELSKIFKKSKDFIRLKLKELR